MELYCAGSMYNFLDIKVLCVYFNRALIQSTAASSEGTKAAP